MKVRLLSQAGNELDEAVRYYDHQLLGLGLRFFKEVDEAIDRIRRMPEAWAKIGEHTRRCLLKGFPYALFYVTTQDEIVITAVANLHREPGHYSKRIS